MHMAGAMGPSGRVYAFEPLDANAEMLERSIAENRFGDRVVFQRAAAGAATGTATLTFPVETLNSGGAYLLREGTAPLTGNQKKDVPVVALDAAANALRLIADGGEIAVGAELFTWS